MLRFLFVQAMQPYLRHMHTWAFTTHVRCLLLLLAAVAYCYC